MNSNQEEKTGKMALSKLTKALIQSIRAIKPKRRPHELGEMVVSKTASFLAIVYEKVRNAIEYREEHLLRRAAIERILKRRLGLNPEGKDEAENILKELMWARYIEEGSIGEEDIENVQQIIDKCIRINSLYRQNNSGKKADYFDQFLLDMLTCELEETLMPVEANREASFTFYIFQILHQKIKIEGLEEDQKNALLIAAIDQTYRKSDKSYQRYHLFSTMYKPLFQYSIKELERIYEKLPDVFKQIDEIIRNPILIKLNRFIKKQLPPFLVLFELFRTKFKDIELTLSDKQQLWHEVQTICNEKYSDAQKKLRGLAIRSLIYIFITKMVFAIILEYPISQYLYNEVNYISIGINTLFPPLLMLAIVLFIKLPGEENTKKIYKRVLDIVDEDASYETQIAYIAKKTKERRPLLIFFFTIFYSLTFFFTLLIIYEILNLLHFNLISQTIFIFFVSVITFFSFRIKQVADEYKMGDKGGILTPFVDIFFLPIISIGKFLSSEIGKINIFIVLFDVIIETPFKLVVEIFEEWIRFIRARNEEIV